MSQVARFDELLLANLTGSDVVAAVGPDGRLTGAELLAAAGGAAAHLDSCGAPVGTPVAALLDSSPRAMAHLVAGVLGDRPLAPLSPRSTVAELGPVLAALAPAVLLVEPAYLDLAAGAVARSGLGVRVVAIEDPEPVERDWRGRAGDVAIILHTSGTTGQPKPVLQSQVPLVPRVRGYCDAVGMGPGDLFCAAAPFHHTAGAGMALVAFGAGAGVATLPWFSLEAWSWVQQVRPTHVLLVPTMIEMLLAAGQLDAGMHTVIYGAAPIHPDTVVAMLAALPGARLYQTFGQTEVSPVTALTHADHLAALDGHPELLGTVGRAVPGAEVRIEGPDEAGIGEVAVRCAHNFHTDPDGWHRLGDLGRLDDEGYLHLSGRRGDMIIRGGENIYPVEVEHVLARHPGVFEAAVVGVPDRRLGEVPLAVVVPADPAALPDVDELRAYARERLAPFKVPVEWRFTDALPRNPAGKVQRRLLIPDAGLADPA